MTKDNIIFSKVNDKIKLFEKTGKVCSTQFLDPADLLDLKSTLKNIPHTIFGGVEDAERNMIIVGEYDYDSPYEFVAIVRIESNKLLNHRDVLGSLLGLGIKRDVIGDIIIKENISNVFVSKDISKYIAQNLDKIGKEKIKCSLISKDELIDYKKEFKEIKTTVASLRLDAIISSAYGLSREISSKLIEGEKVKLNYKVTTNSSKQVKVSDLISVRGYGRFVFDEVVGETRKDRIRIILKIYK